MLIFLKFNFLCYIFVLNIIYIALHLHVYKNIHNVQTNIEFWKTPC
jgi:hypothetical protein